MLMLSLCGVWFAQPPPQAAGPRQHPPAPSGSAPGRGAPANLETPAQARAVRCGHGALRSISRRTCGILANAALLIRYLFVLPQVPGNQAHGSAAVQQEQYQQPAVPAPTYKARGGSSAKYGALRQVSSHRLSHVLAPCSLCSTKRSECTIVCPNAL